MRRPAPKPATRHRATRVGRPTQPARKRFGQHFLSNAWAQRVVAAVAAQPGDVFLEIGPGRGALTLPLALTGAPILAVEIDRDLVKTLAASVPPNVTVLSGDVLSADVLSLLGGLEPQRPLQQEAVPIPSRRFRVVGNLPYNIASPILVRLIDWHRRHGLFADATVMVQREMADRLVAKPGTKDYGVLTVMLALHTSVTRLLDLPMGAFSPPPKVRSSVVRLVFGPPAVRLPDEALFERMVKAMFGQRRKTLSNALKSFDATAPAVLALAGVDGSRRPETLQLVEIARLAELFAAVKQPPVL
jgi:16S rRNA (adenine1518-N6/adenine1519-N6)-dimethyltransferase